MPGPGRTLCLNMIVRNEVAILERCLTSVAGYIACWVIGDTGSTDGTPDLIQRFFEARGIPGELHRFGFETFEQARNEALARARASCLAFDYVLFADADMELIVDDPTCLQPLTAAAYRVRQQAGISYLNTRLLRRDVPAEYKGVTHEYIDVPIWQCETLSGISFIDHANGSNRADKFERDIRLLLTGINQAPNIARYHFYLAQSYRDAGRWEEAARTYAHRSSLGGWDEEVWYSKLQEARCYLRLGRDADFLAKAVEAYDLRPHRAEPLLDLAKFYRLRGMNSAGAMICEAGLDIAYPTGDALFIEDDVYNGGLKEEFSIVANYSQKPAQKDRGKQVCNELSMSRAVPEQRRNTARRNLTFYARRLDQIIGGVEFAQIRPPLEAGWAVMNPSVAVWRNGLSLIQRTVNCRFEGGRYQTPSNAPCVTRNFLAALDNQLDITSWTEILPPIGHPAPVYSAVQGFENMRLIVDGDDLWCSSTMREVNPEGWCEQYLARIELPTQGGPCRLGACRRLSPDGARRHERNWTPQVVDGALRFISSYQDSIVVSSSGQEIRRSPSRLAVDHLRGGSQAIAFDNGWLSVCREVTLAGSQRHYFHRFAWFDGATSLSRLSEPFKLSKEPVEFVAGLARHPQADTLVVSYGVADRESWLASVPVEEICRLLDSSAAASAPPALTEWVVN